MDPHDAWMLPHEILPVNLAERELHVRVLVIGDSASDAVVQAHQVANGLTSDADSQEAGEQPTLSCITLWLGTIRGIKTAIHLFGMGAPDPLLEALMVTELSHLDGVVVVQAGDEALPFIGAVARGLASLESLPPIALVGPFATGLWRSHEGAEAVYEGEEDSSLFPALKFLVQESLARRGL